MRKRILGSRRGKGRRIMVERSMNWGCGWGLDRKEGV